MTANLPLDRRRCKRGERDPTARIEALARLDEANRPELDKILQVLAAPCITPRDRLNERQMRLCQLFSR